MLAPGPADEVDDDGEGTLVNVLAAPREADEGLIGDEGRSEVTSVDDDARTATEDETWEEREGGVEALRDVDGAIGEDGS